MTKAELIEALEEFDDETDVMFAYNSKDYLQTEVAEIIRDVDIQEVIHSEYHRKYQVLEDSEEGSQQVIIIR